MYVEYAYIFALVANLVWFSMGVHYFSFKNNAAAKVAIPKHLRDSPLFKTHSVSIRFLGGMNGAWALMCLILLYLALTGSVLFSAPIERSIILFIIASAHFSQFYFNVPIHRNGGRQGDAYWNVTSGPMLMIFVVDALETVLNVGIGGYLIVAS